MAIQMTEPYVISFNPQERKKSNHLHSQDSKENELPWKRKIGLNLEKVDEFDGSHFETYIYVQLVEF